MEIILSKKWVVNHRTKIVLCADSDCINDCSDDLTEINEKIVRNSQMR